MIIDAHSHWLPQDIIKNAHFFSASWGDIESQAGMMEEAGIDKAVLSYPTSDAHLKIGSLSKVARIYNDNIAEVLKRYPKRFIGSCVLPVGDSKEMAEELKRCLDLGFKAISLASSYDGVYLDDSSFLPVYSLAQEKGIPIFVHAQIVKPIGTERMLDPLLTPVIEYIFDITTCIGKLLMAGILKDYAQTAFIFANFGGAVPFLQHRFDSTYQMLRGINFVKDLGADPTQYLKNIYVDTGGDKVKTNFLLALELLGPKHLLWGSDWPAKKDISGSIQAVKDLNIPAEDKQAILGANLQKFLQE